MPEIRDRSIVMVGATGAVGTQVLQKVLADDYYERVVVVTRRPIAALVGHAKAEERIVDFEDLAAHSDAFAARDVFCGLGTTRKKAGSKQKFERIDHDYPLEVGRLAKAAGARRYILISSVGAAPKAWGLYLKTKGRLEEGLKALGFESLQILRPSLLISEREEERPGEKMGIFLDKHLNFLIPKRYKGIDVKTIAARVLALGKADEAGERVWESEEI